MSQLGWRNGILVLPHSFGAVMWWQEGSGLCTEPWEPSFLEGSMIGRCERFWALLLLSESSGVFSREAVSVVSIAPAWATPSSGVLTLSASLRATCTLPGPFILDETHHNRSCVVQLRHLTRMGSQTWMLQAPVKKRMTGVGQCKSIRKQWGSGEEESTGPS